MNKEVIKNKIYTIRGLQVMLDRDLAELYGVKAIKLREQVKRNKERFPINFMFQLTITEAMDMVSQNATPSKKHFGGSLPYVFTELTSANKATKLITNKNKANKESGYKTTTNCPKLKTETIIN